MDQLSTQTAVGSEDITDDSTSMLDVQWSSDEELSSDPQGQCLPAPQPPLPTYKQRLDEFKKLFKELPESERLIVDYPCALQRDILLQGRLYLAENWLCFYSNVFRGTKITLTLKDITSMTREKTARLIPNAIQICTATDKFFFTSFSAREKSYQGVFRMWQNTLLDKGGASSDQHFLNVRPGSDQCLQRAEAHSCGEMASDNLELWQMVKQHYGNDLGLSHEEMESLHILQTARPGERVSKRSALSLDLNANQNDASEQSGSETNEDVEERVVTSEVQGRLFINKVFHISANKMFELLFTDSSFIRRFMIVRKTTSKRQLYCLAERRLRTHEAVSELHNKYQQPPDRKILHRYREPDAVQRIPDGQYYLLDSEVYTHDVPYHDYFYTQNRVYTDVKYKKQPWGLVKSFITKNSWSGIEDYFRQLEAELLEEEAEMNQGGGDTGKIGGLRRRRRTYSRTLPEHMKPNKQPHRNEQPARMELHNISDWDEFDFADSDVDESGSVFQVVGHGGRSAPHVPEHQASAEGEERSPLGPDYMPRQGPEFQSREDAQLLKNVLQDSINLLEQLSLGAAQELCYGQSYGRPTVMLLTWASAEILALWRIKKDCGSELPLRESL
ncbi:hypothetical protein F7725_029091 [Dissostichus mawsoni]|uniref:VASt domain-containing protein n=1 Tax=Dissostichus mawsoni TaxID=36200 RepID=A0A7J5XI71_DISMA|nr:hypothetical protein F7725_029091 [Dissostichus mawsoni]